MATKTKPSDETEGETKHTRLFELSRKMLLASVGAMAMAQDEIEEFVDKLIEHGEVAEKEGRKLVHELSEQRKKRARRVEDEASKRVHEAMEHLDIPTKADIDALNEKLAQLMKKVDELSKH